MGLDNTLRPVRLRPGQRCIVPPGKMEFRGTIQGGYQGEDIRISPRTEDSLPPHVSITEAEVLSDCSVRLVLSNRSKKDAEITDYNILAELVSSDSSRKLAAIVGPSSEETVVVGGIETVGLIDSGSQVTTMSMSFYKSHFTSQPIRKLEEEFCIMGAGGQKVPYMGYISVPLTLPVQWAGTDKAVETMILICPDTPLSGRVPIIVGTNAFRLLSSKTKG